MFGINVGELWLTRRPFLIHTRAMYRGEAAPFLSPLAFTRNFRRTERGGILFIRRDLSGMPIAPDYILYFFLTSISLQLATNSSIEV